MKRLLLIFVLIIGSLYAELGESGSEVEVEEAKLLIQLVKDDNTTVTILDGTKYLKLSGSNSKSSSIIDSLEGIKPPEGNYTHIQWIPKGFRVKAKVKINGVFYYTKNETVPEDDITPWNVTTDESKYDFTTIRSGGEDTVTALVRVKFPQPLEIKKDKPVNLYIITRFGDNVLYDKIDNSDKIRNISSEMELFAFTTVKPAKRASFDLVYKRDNGRTLKNRITLFYDEEGDVVGTYCSEGIGEYEGAIHGSFVTSIETLSKDKYKLTVIDDADENGENEIIHKITFNLDCDKKSYSNLEVNQWATDIQGGTLTKSGSATCVEMNILE